MRIIWQHRTVTSRIDLQTAYILHTRPYRDTSLIADVFTPQFGTLALIGRGARGTRSRLRGIVQPFRRLVVSWAGRSELRTLTRAEEDGAPLWLTGQALVIGIYLNELVLRLMERDDPHPVIFAHYEAMLAALATQPPAATDPGIPRRLYERSLRIFEKVLLRELGYGLILDHDVGTGDAIDPAAMYRYDCLRGPSLDGGGSNHDDHADVMLVRGASLSSLDGGKLDDPQSLQDAKKMLRTALARHLGGRPLNSRRLLTTYRNPKASTVATHAETATGKIDD